MMKLTNRKTSGEVLGSGYREENMGNIRNK